MKGRACCARHKSRNAQQPKRSRLRGDLTIRDLTHPIEVEFVYEGSSVDPLGFTRVGFTGHGVLVRKNWGLSYNQALETGGVLVSEKVQLEFDVSVVRKP